MDIHYIPTKFITKEYKNFDKLIGMLPKNIGLVATTQYIDIAKEIKKILENKGFVVYTKKSDFYPEMIILGCEGSAADVNADTVLLIGSGKFHALEIARKFNKKVIVYDPISGNISVIKDDTFQKKISILLYEIKNSKKIGIITSIKPGQYYLKKILKIKEELKKKDKEVFLFLTDNIIFDELQNFPDIDFWIIAACPRLIDDIFERKIRAITIDILEKYIREI